jgi:hypothetical protein
MWGEMLDKIEVVNKKVTKLTDFSLSTREARSGDHP